MARIAVVGAGAAGIFASWKAATDGAAVTLFEKTPRIGTKILISGGGKCNITHHGPLEDLIRAFRPNEARFIRPACYRLTNAHVIEMITSRGLEVYTRPDGRVFPKQGTAKDVVAILAAYVRDAGVKVELQTPVEGIVCNASAASGVRVGGGIREFDAVIVCVGGSSYPNSGTTGDGWIWARDCGHTIVRPMPALAPIDTDPRPPEGRAGVALRDIELKARKSGRMIASWRGDMLFTHHGTSGPTVLGISRIVAENLHSEPVLLESDLLPDESFETLQRRVVNWCQNNPKKAIVSFANEFVPNALVDQLLNQASVDRETTAQHLSKKQKNRLVEVIKAFSIGRAKRVVLEKGEVVAGGISLDEVNPHTMQSKLISGLFLCGEVLDIAGPVGGYNLQAAFSTGFVAGESAAKFAEEG